MKYLFIVFLIPFVVKGQIKENDSLKLDTSNPIIFAEGYVGLLGSEFDGGVSLGGNLNWQFHKRDLLTVRVAYFGGFSQNYVMLSPFTPFPVIKDRERVREYGVLYGKRYVLKNGSFSFSGGIAYYDRNFYEEQLNGYTFEKENYFGFPIELNYKFFKSKKQRFRAYYGIIPIGKKKVAFGRSFGFKFYGNISRNSHLGFGITYGFGTHKDYSEVEENP